MLRSRESGISIHAATRFVPFLLSRDSSGFRDGHTVIFRIGGHVGMPFELCAGMYRQYRSRDITAEASGGLNLGLCGGLDIPDDVAVDVNGADANVGVNNGIDPDNQLVAVDRAVKVSIDSDHAGELQFAGKAGSLIEEARNMLFLRSPKLHSRSFC